VKAFRSKFQVKEIVYDAWRATQLAHQLAADGATVIEMPQAGARWRRPDRLNAALAADAHHDGNPVLEWMAANTFARSIRRAVVEQGSPTRRCSGIVAICMPRVQRHRNSPPRNFS
jgi:phage terminase large subunit-like protein